MRAFMLGMFAAADKRGYRFPGGYWRNAANAELAGGTNTMHSLLTRGMISVEKRLPRGDASEIRLTADGIAECEFLKAVEHNKREGI